MITGRDDKKGRLVVYLIILLVLGFLTTSLVSYYVSRSSLRSQIDTSALPLTSDNIYSEIQRDLVKLISISSFMAQDTFLRNWILAGEKDTNLVISYLAEIKNRYDTLTSFFVSDRTSIYYQDEGILKIVDPEEERDVWYYRVREMENDYEINVDPDMANNDTMTVFINYKVFDYNDNFLGATGVGLAINSISDLMEKYSQKYGRTIYFVDPNGNIIFKGISDDIDKESIYDIDGLEKIADNLLRTESEILRYNRGNLLVHLNTRFIEELGLHLFVEQTEESTVASINKALILNLFFFLLITSIIITLTTITIKAYQKINRSQQVEISKKNQELSKQNQDLEKVVGEKTQALERNTLLLQEMSHRVKNNLSTIQSLLSIQASQVKDEKSRQALKDSESRLMSISHLHKMLSGKIDLTRINVAGYIRRMIDDISRAFDIDRDKIKIIAEIDKIALDMNILVPFALILNELVTNALKYAFKNRDDGILTVSLHSGDHDELVLEVKDNGIGLPERFDPDKVETLGIRIITLLTDQINGRLSHDSKSGKGTSFRLIFPAGTKNE